MTQALKHLRGVGIAQTDEDVRDEDNERITHRPSLEKKPVSVLDVQKEFLQIIVRCKHRATSQSCARAQCKRTFVTRRLLVLL
jgi:hypothetical protein